MKIPPQVISAVFSVIQSRLGISGDQILANDRHGKIVDARQIAVVLLHDVLCWSQISVSLSLFRHRSTIEEASKTGNNRIDTEKQFKQMFLDCLNELQTNHQKVFYAKEITEAEENS